MTSTVRCCCCTAISPSGANEVCTGVWSAGTEANGLQTASDNAKVLFLRHLNSQPWRAVVTVKVVTSGAGATFAVRLIGMADGCLSGLSSSAPSYGSGVHLEWGYDHHGEYFELHDTRTPFDTSTCGTPIAAGTVTTIRTLQMCWDGATLTASWVGIGTGKFLAASQAIVPGSGRFGFSTLDLDANVVSVEFYDFNVYYVPDGLGGHARCDACPPDHCCLGPVPSSLVLELSGLSSEALGLIIDPTLCHANCTDLEGTYYLAAAGGGSILCGGGLECVWLGGLYLESAPCDGIFGLPHAPQAWTWSISATITADGSGNRMLLVTLTSTNVSPSTMLRLYALTDAPCVDWTDWINLSKYDGTCDLGGYPVARIKAA